VTPHTETANSRLSAKLVLKSAFRPPTIGWTRNVVTVPCNFKHFDVTFILDGSQQSGQVTITQSSKREVMDIAITLSWNLENHDGNNLEQGVLHPNKSGAGFIGKGGTKCGIYVCCNFTVLQWQLSDHLF